MTVYYRDRPIESRIVTRSTRLPDDRRRADGGRVGIQLRRDRVDPVGSHRLLEANGGSYVRACDRHLPELRKRDALGNIVTDSADHRSHVAYPIRRKRGARLPSRSSCRT